MTNYKNLPLALFQSLRDNFFTEVITDYGRPEPIRMKGWTVLVLALFLSRKIRTYECSRIGLALPPGVAGVLGNLAVLFAGKTPVNLNLTVSKDSIISSLHEAEIEVMLSAEKVRSKFPEFPWADHFIDLGDWLAVEKNKKGPILFLALQLLCFSRAVLKKFKLHQIGINRQEAVLLFTSGSSSQPKGVVLSDENILSNCTQMNALDLFNPNMTLLGNLPLFHSFGLTVGTFFPLLFGLRIVAAPSPLDYKSSLRAIREGRAEVLLGTPTFLRGYLRKAKSDDFKSVRFVVAGAEKSPPDLINVWENEFGCEYLEGYGLTECSPGISFNLPGRGKKVESVGRLMKNIDGRTVDPETRVVLDKNETGVLSFRGPNIFAGYLNNPEKTKEVFSDDGWFMTGDLGRMDEDGFLFIEGRLSRFSKVGGEMVSHESVEDVIAGLLSVYGHTSDDILCAVTGIEDGSKGECLVLLSTVAVNSKWLGDNLRNKGIPNLWIPKHIKKTEKIPILGTGKLDLRKLKELAEA
jgi:acyl-[acyl-carrier-protein]-phospholipid O-acyltransferase/long-chain-fatty-acid--[acyl-carrier-protein] ligase